MLRALMFVLAFALYPMTGQAGDPTGSWRVDAQGFQAQFSAMLEKELAELPEAMRPQMEQMMQGMMQQMHTQMAGVATFHADGTVEFVRDNGNIEKGRWESLGDDRVKIIAQRGDQIEARIEGDRMIAEVDDEESGMPIELIWNRE